MFILIVQFYSGISHSCQ